MNQRLYAAARRQGVETHYNANPQQPEHPIMVAYSDNDIAMDVLAKLPNKDGEPEWMIAYNAPHNHWHWAWEPTDEQGIGTFIEAVVALEERSRSETD